MQISLKNGHFGFCNEFLGEFRIHKNNNSNNLKLHINNLTKLLKHHVFEIQDFSDKDRLWNKVKPRLTLTVIKSNFEINFLEGFKHLVHLLKNSKLKHLKDLFAFMISKIKT